MRQILFPLLLLLTTVLHAQQNLVLKNTCSGSAEPALFTDAVNYFRIENWPGKSLMNLECSNCEIEFEDAGGIFKLIPSSALIDTLKVFRDEKQVAQFILPHKEASGLEAHLSKGRNKTISRKFLNTNTEVLVKAGKPGCRTTYQVKEFDLVFSAGITVHCKGSRLSQEAIKKLQELQPGMQFNLENTVYLKEEQPVKLPVATYFLKD